MLPNFGTCTCQPNASEQPKLTVGRIMFAPTRKLPNLPNRPSITHRPPVRPVHPAHGSYRRLSGLGQISITGNPTIDSLLENPWTLALLGVAGFAAWYFLVPSFSTSGGSLHVKRRRAPTVSLPTAALLALGGAAAGYLLTSQGQSL